MKTYQQIRRQSRPRRMAAAKPAPSEANRAALQDALGYPLQTKLQIGAPEDAHEREADAVAARVMAAPDATVQRKCAACAQEDEQQKADMPKPEKDEEVRRKESGGEAQISPSVAAAIGASRGGGQALPGGERTFFESRMGADFGAVRIHTDDQAARLSAGLAARAFTTGSDVFFGAGEYRPGTRSGRQLLAHELTHVLQQGADSTLRREKKTATPTLAAPVKTGLLAASGFGNWSYVAYLDEKRVLLGRNIKSGEGVKRIGSIPWITRNPGNITVSTAPESETGPGAKEAFKQGAYAKGAGQNDAATRRYAIFPTVSKGLAAIWPQLQIINKGNGGNLTLIAAMKIFKGREPNEAEGVKDAYVADIMKFMVGEILAEAPSLEEPEALEQARRILYRPLKELGAGDMEYEIARNALVTKEGGLVAPGIDYNCKSGFADNTESSYTKEQWADMQRLKTSAEVKAELRALLGCE